MLRQLLWKFALPILAILALATYVAAPYVDRLLTNWFRTDIELRSRALFNSMEYALVSLARDPNPTNLSQYLERQTADERLHAIIVCDSAANLISRSASAPASIDCKPAATLARGQTLNLDGKSFHVARFVAAAGSAAPLNIVLVHDLSFIDRRQVSARDYLIAVVFLISVVVVLIVVGIAWLILKSWIRGLIGDIRRKSFLDELAGAPGSQREVLSQVRTALRELESSQRLEIDYRENWTPEALQHLVKERLESPEMMVVSNREPYVHNRAADGSIEVSYPASGMVTAVEPVIRACAGLWLAHGSGSADRDSVDRDDRLKVPPGDPSYTLQRIWLTEEEEQGYYYGFANEGMWPLCHVAHVRPVFRESDWEAYRLVNQRFADAVVKEARTEDPVVLVQDYHFALLPAMIRAKLPRATILTFWHIPWPNPESFAICPWRQEILAGLLGSSILGFHTQFHCNNFVDTVDRFMEARVDRENFTVTFRGKSTAVRRYPISVDWPPAAEMLAKPAEQCADDVRARNALPPGHRICIGVDRLDYTKGILERFRAVERLLELNPEWIGRFSLIQIAAPTRSSIDEYQSHETQVRALAVRINERFDGGRSLPPPILLKVEHHDAQLVYEYYRGADCCFVSSLHDGMNLVAKEYVAAQDPDDPGVLILSLLAGAALEMKEALLVNPHDLDGVADAIATAAAMPLAERKERWNAMMARLLEYDIHAWRRAYLEALEAA